MTLTLELRKHSYKTEFPHSGHILGGLVVRVLRDICVNRHLTLHAELCFSWFAQMKCYAINKIVMKTYVFVLAVIFLSLNNSYNKR